VVVGGLEIRTDADGTFKAERVPPEASLIVTGLREGPDRADQGAGGGRPSAAARQGGLPDLLRGRRPRDPHAGAGPHRADGAERRGHRRQG
jgi:hypothetical protein